MHGRGRAWQGGMCARGACMAGGVHGRGHAWQGACMAGGMHGRGGEHGRGRGHAWHTVSERAVRILLKCILVYLKF